MNADGANQSYPSGAAGKVSGTGIQSAVGRIAVVDIGSNTVRLVVYDALARLPVPVFNERVACGLGKGIGQSGKLDAAGVDLALQTLNRFTNLAREMGVDRFEMLATAAVRDASDGPAFVAEVERRFAVPVTVLSGEDEARLAGLGILAGTPNADGLLGDMGGGSLDLMGMNAGTFGQSKTLPLGYLRIIEESEGDIRAARSIVERHFDSIPWLSDYRGRPIYVVGGGWRALARLSIEQSDYPLHVLDNYTMDLDAIEQLTGLIAGLSAKSLGNLSGVARRRVETLPFTALALHRLLECVQPSGVIFSGYSMREGKLFELLPDELRKQDPLISACEGFARRSGRFPEHGEETMRWLVPLISDGGVGDQRLSLAAALLSDIGWTEHPDYRALHAFTRVLRFPIAGVSHRDRVFLALAIFVRYNGSRRQYEVNQVRQLLTDTEEHAAEVLGMALRLAHVLSGGVAGLLPRTELQITNKRLTLRLSPHENLFISEATERLFGSLAKLLDLKSEIT